MKGIKLCGECADYDWKKHKCRRCSYIESNPQNSFYDDCPLPDVVEVVRCKDCKHLVKDPHDIPYCEMHSGLWVDADDWYCADGVRKG